MEQDQEEWRDSLFDIYREHGDAGVREILAALVEQARDLGVDALDAPLNTSYVNTIKPHDQPAYPADLDLEARIESINRWNAVAMVLQAADRELGVGGHIATYASCATMLEVGFNHFFRGASEGRRGDLVMPQPHVVHAVKRP